MKTHEDKNCLFGDVEGWNKINKNVKNYSNLVAYHDTGATPRS